MSQRQGTARERIHVGNQDETTVKEWLWTLGHLLRVTLFNEAMYFMLVMS
jgi:hypothetical protein